MAQTDRFSVSLDTELLAAFDSYILAKRYDNRSEAIRDLIRDALLAGHTYGDDVRVSGVLSFLWDRRVEVDARRLRDCLVAAQQVDTKMSLRNIHTNFDHATVELAGQMSDVRVLTNRIQALKSVKHAHLATLSTNDLD